MVRYWETALFVRFCSQRTQWSITGLPSGWIVKKEDNLLWDYFKEGIFLNPMGTKVYIYLAHTDEDIQKLLEISKKVLQKIF